MTDLTSESRRKAFTSIYDRCYWGTENLSGPGSSVAATEKTREIVLKVIDDYGITSVVDVACGDFVWMPIALNELNGPVQYTGCDIVEDLIARHTKEHAGFRFQSLDFVTDEIPEGELIICRDALQHLQVRDVKKALANFSASGARYLLASTHMRRFGYRNRRDIRRPGKCKGRNLLVAPFDLPNPLVIYCEQLAGEDKFLGLWELPFQRATDGPPEKPQLSTENLS